MRRKSSVFSQVFFSFITVISLSFIFVPAYFEFEAKKDQNLVFSQAMERMGDWFARNQESEGDFIYSMSVPEGQVSEDTNNIVRQAGSLYALAQLYKTAPNEKTKSLLMQGFAYFKSLTYTIGKDKSAVVYRGEKKTNASALLLLGYVEFIEADPDAAQLYTEDAKRLSNYIVSTQNPIGSYRNDDDPLLAQSDYNNGESMYALIRAYKLFGNPVYLQSVKTAADFFTNYYAPEGGFNKSFYSWGMAAFAHLYQIEPKKQYWSFLRGTTDQYFKEAGNDYSTYINEGQGKEPSPGTVVFLEGVAHVAWIAQEVDRSYYLKLKDYLSDSLSYFQQYQLDSEQTPLASTKLDGAVCQNISCDHVRIDTTQHNLSAIYLYLTLVDQRKIDKSTIGTLLF